MNTHTTRDGVLESIYTDADIEHTIVATPTPPDAENPTYPPAILKAFKRAKKASVIHDARSSKIAAALRLEREGIAKPSVKATRQATLSF